MPLKGNIGRTRLGAGDIAASWVEMAFCRRIAPFSFWVSNVYHDQGRNSVSNSPADMPEVSIVPGWSSYSRKQKNFDDTPMKGFGLGSEKVRDMIREGAQWAAISKTHGEFWEKLEAKRSAYLLKDYSLAEISEDKNGVLYILP